MKRNTLAAISLFAVAVLTVIPSSKIWFFCNKEL